MSGVFSLAVLENHAIPAYTPFFVFIQFYKKHSPAASIGWGVFASASWGMH
jgi:hypothetical protein